MKLIQLSEYDLKQELVRTIAQHKLTKAQILKRMEFDSAPELVNSALFYLVAMDQVRVVQGRYYPARKQEVA